jgi:hypothetical protein
MPRGPLIPGVEEFDAPRRGVPWLVWAILLAALVAVAFTVALGLLTGAGPLRALGQVASTLQPVAYRPTTDELVMSIAVTLPPNGLCPDDEVQVVAFERGSRVEVDAKVEQSRNATCPETGIAGDSTWIDVRLTQPLGDRSVIRLSDRQPLQRDR